MATRHLVPLPLPFRTKTFTLSPLLLPFPKIPSKTLLSPFFSFVSSSSMASSASKKVLVPIANGTEPIEAVVTVDVLRRGGAEVTVASAWESVHLYGCWGVKLVADSFVSDCAGSEFDLIALPGGMPGAASLRDCKVLEQMVKKHAENGKICAAICAAPAVALGSWGLLKGLKATCHPSFMEKLPYDVTKVECRVQVDGNVVTSRGPGTAMEFSLALIELLYGKEKAEEVAGPMVIVSHSL